MSVRLNSAVPYGAESNHIKTDRGVEFEALAGITRQLKLLSGSGATNFPALCAAIHKNRQLWTILAADVATEDNKLPSELRSRIFFLAEFVALHSRNVLKKTVSTDALIDINVAMMRGLTDVEMAK